MIITDRNAKEKRIGEISADTLAKYVVHSSFVR